MNPFSIATKYLTVAEKNTAGLPLVGDLLLNRIVWLGITLLLLFFIYSRFSFNTKNEKVKKAQKVKNETSPITTFKENLKPTKANVFSLLVFWNLVKFETKAVIKNPTFIILVAIGLMMEHSITATEK